MNASMHVSMYMCMHICRHVFVRAFLCMYVCMHALFVCIYACMHICMYVNTSYFCTCKCDLDVCLFITCNSYACPQYYATWLEELPKRSTFTHTAYHPLPTFLGSS